MIVGVKRYGWCIQYSTNFQIEDKKNSNSNESREAKEDIKTRHNQK